MEDPPDEPVKLSSRLRTGHDFDKVPEPKARKQRREAPRHERAIMQGKNEWPGR
jgi:hypothetical protein